MRSLLQSLQDFDHGHLRIIAELWGLEPPADSQADLAAWLAQTMLEGDLLSEIVDGLPTGRPALDRLMAEGGRLPWADFEQQYGPLREMGPGRRDREKPWRHPASDTEALYYRGLIGRAFGDTPAGPKEFAYIPTELRSKLPKAPASAAAEIATVGADPTIVFPATSSLVDDLTTLLAALRRRTGAEDSDRQLLAGLSGFLTQPDARPLLLPLAVDLGLIDPDGRQAIPGRIGSFLETPRHLALAELQTGWRQSETWNDFRLLTHLRPEPGGWPGEPTAIRAAALELVDRLPRLQWIELEPFLQAVRENYPSFLRPGADFDSWYLRDRRTGAFLRGAGAWPSVDGALLRAIVTGPLHWFGAADLGSEDGNDQPDRFRLTHWFDALMNRERAPEITEPDANGRIGPDGRIALPRAASRQLRYQIARLCSWLSLADDVYHYRLRPSAVLASGELGVRPTHIRQLLESIGEPVPTAVLRGLDRLDQNGIEARLERPVVLAVTEPALLDELMARPQTSRLIRLRLGPRAASVDPANVERLLQLAARAGLFIEPVGGKASGQ